MPTTRLNFFLGFFFLLLAANVILGHSLASRFIDTARDIQQAERAGLDVEEAVPLRQEQIGRGGLLIVTNVPLFAGLGWIVRAEEPGTGPLYWVLLFLGSTYVPLFLTACVYFLIFPPRGPGAIPGVDIDDGSNDPEEDDDDDDPRPT